MTDYYEQIVEANREIARRGNRNAMIARAIIMRKLQAGLLREEIAAYRLKFEATRTSTYRPVS